MISAYESYIVNTMINYYDHDYSMFFEYLDEGVIWYGPKEKQYIVGKENLMKALQKYPPTVKFHIDNIRTQLISTTSNVYTLVMSYRLHSLHPKKGEKVYLQRVVVNGHKCRDHDGKIFWRCPFIQVSNVIPKNDDSAFLIKGVGAEKSFALEETSKKRLVLPGDNHSTIYIAEESIRYIVGGKGILCYVYTDEDVYTVRLLLKDVLRLLGDNFYRCHSSYIVNLDRLLFLNSKKITLNDTSEIPISSRRYAEIKKDISDYIKKDFSL